MHKCSRKNKREKASKSRSQSIASGVCEFDDVSQDGGECDGEPTYKVKISKIMGRYLVAAKELRPGSIIMRESPIVVGPCAGCNVQCIGCYQPLEPNKYSKCKSCLWPLCSHKCLGIGSRYGHTLIECTTLRECESRRFLDYSDFAKLRENLWAIVPFRCLVTKLTDAKSYELLRGMESHNEIRKKIDEVWELNQEKVVDKIRKEWGLVEFEEEEIHTICGILEVNCFEIGQQGINIRGLYPTAFLMSHDCVPNTNHSDDLGNFTLTVRASTTIPQNHPITLSYAYTLQSTLKRRQHLLENKFFECRCRRCRDPTELGTYTGALICPKCPDGLVLSTDPLDAYAPWRCSGCAVGYQMTAATVDKLIGRVTAEADALDANDVEGMEAFLGKYRNVLHPTHYLNLGVKLSLSQLYGKIRGYMIQEMSVGQLVRKRELCLEIMRVFDVIEPGYTRIRGVTLYELHAPIMILLTRQFEQKNFSRAELRNALKEVVGYLREAAIILSFEPSSSCEAMIGVAAKDALLRIKDWEKIIGKI